MVEQDPPAPDVPETFTAEYVAELRREADRRVVLAELKSRALAAGMLDADGLKLLDLSAVKMRDGGEIEIPDSFFEQARKSKPYLFGRPAAGSTARAPEIASPRPRNAVEMSTEEWRSAREDLLRRR